MKRTQFKCGGLLELLNPASYVTRLSQMTLYPLGLQTPSRTVWGGGQGGEVGCVSVSSAARLPRGSLSNTPVGVQGAVTALGK